VILGMSVAAFTTTHVILSLIALMSGIAVVRHLMVSRTPAGITALFLVTTFLTCAGGFLYRSKAIGPGHYIGAISLAILLPVVVALYGQRLAGAARWIYALGAVVLLYLNAVIAVIQTFIKVPFLKPLVTSLASPALVLAQLALLALLLWIGTRAVRRFHPEADHHGGLALPI
jgi:hypothetical protein